jgi:hypothetical protein
MAMAEFLDDPAFAALVPRPYVMAKQQEFVASRI